MKTKKMLEECCRDVDLDGPDHAFLCSEFRCGVEFKNVDKMNHLFNKYGIKAEFIVSEDQLPIGDYPRRIFYDLLHKY